MLYRLASITKGVIQVKKWSVLLTLALIASVFLTACGQGGSGGEGGGSQDLSLATGSTGGTYYPLGGAIANVWNKNVEGVNVTAQATGASVENLALLAKGEAHLAMVVNMNADDAYNGRADFEGQKVTNFGAIGVVYPEVVQAVVAKDSNIKTVSDLKGKRVAVGPQGSGTVNTTKHILEAYGLTFDDIQPFYDSFGDAATKLKDGQVDAIFGLLSLPASNIEDITTAKEVRLLEVDDKAMKKLQEKYPFYQPLTIEGGTYKGQDEDVQTATLKAVMYANNDLSEDLVYNLTKTMYEKKDDIASAHQAGSQIDLEKALEGVTTPIHPGAKKYFEEKGIPLPE
jgi:TRAP transporter TAXI family solute receptor